MAKLKLKKSNIASKIPTVNDLDWGELAINYADGKLYYKKQDQSGNGIIDSFLAATGGGGGTVTLVQVEQANGFAGTVANNTTTPQITLSTTISGLLKGNGTSISSAVSGSDYCVPTIGSSLLMGNNSGGFNNVTIGNGLQLVDSTLSVVDSSFTQFTVPMTLSTDWQDIPGLKNDFISTGTYIVQVYANDIGVGGTNSNEYYSGTMSWWSGDTDSSLELPTDEIVLHRAGAGGQGALYLRTYRSSAAEADNLKLQIYANTGTVSNSNYIFKFKKLL